MLPHHQIVSVPEQLRQKPSVDILQSILSRVRGLVLGTLLLGIIGTGIELLLVGHTEDTLQWVPLLLILLCLVVLAWHGVARGAASIRALQVTMALFLLGGVTGLVAHWQGKIEFKRETDPSLSGTKLFLEAMKSQSPPALAPGIFIQIALLGLIYSYRHPALGASKGGSTRSMI